MLEASVYVVLDPVRAGVVEHPRDWAWSSYRASAGFEATPAFVTTEILPNLLSSDPRQLVDEVAARGTVGSVLESG